MGIENEARPDNLDTRLEKLVAQARELEPELKIIKPNEPNYTKLADFVNPVLQLQQLWVSLDEKTKLDMVFELEALQQKL